ncbi:MAG: hypothetical protein ACRDYE_12855 [Acidimicrobiales bacterium]
MPPSDPESGRRRATDRARIGRRPERPDPLYESWDPADDAGAGDGRESGPWDWHARSSWGQRAVTAFPLVAMLGAVALLVSGTAGALRPPVPATVVTGTGGARLVARPGAFVPTDPAAPGGTARYGVVSFTTPSGPGLPLQGSTSWALPPYVGWEANGSAGPSNGTAVASGGLLHVGVRQATTDFRGWFLTTTGTVPDSCAFQFDAASPPAVAPAAPGGVGELVMAVQTGSTATTGDIDYVVVAEVVRADGQRVLQAGYSTGRVRNALEHVLKRVPWGPGPLQVSIETDGQDRLQIWVNGSVFLDATGLQMGITPPFQPYLEVQALSTPYSVAFARYASVCGDDVAVEGLPARTLVSLGGRVVAAGAQGAVLPLDRTGGPVSGVLELSEPGAARPVRFRAHTYWPGDRFVYRAGTAPGRPPS